MFRQLRVHTPAPLTPDGQRVTDQANEMFAISFTPAERRGSQASAGLESRTVAGSEEALGTTTTMTHRSQSDPMTHPPTMISDAALAVGNSENTATVHTPIVPNSSLNLPPNPPRISLSGSVPAQRRGTI
jgi:hypothetical protein